MSDVPRPPDDELVSAYLDGQVNPAERALVEDDPELRRQADGLRQVRDAVGSVPAPADAVREHNIAAALAVYDAEIEPVRAAAARPEVERSTGTVGDLDAARRRRQARRMSLLAVAAAVVLVVVVGAGLLVRSSKNTTDTAALSTKAAPTTPAPASAEANQGVPAAPRAPASPQSGSAAAGQAPPTSAPSAAPSTTVAPDRTAAADGGATDTPAAGRGSIVATYVGDLGPVTPGVAFRAALTPRLDRLDRDRQSGQPPATVTTPSATGDQLTACSARLRGADKELGGPPVLTGTATVNGQDALVLAYELDPSVGNANGAYRAFAVRPDCSVLDTQTL